MHLLLTSASLVLLIGIQTAQSSSSVCEDPPDINFASVTEVSDATYSVGTTVTYGCQFGYVASGKSRNLRCRNFGGNAEWTEQEFLCMPQSCGDPGFVPNGQRVGSLFTFPNSVRYLCDTGYNLRGIATRYCQTSGTWSGRLPVCEVVTCAPPKNPENGHVTASSYEYGSELNYKCDKGFSLSTDDVVYCTEDGTWSRSDITCIEIVCEIPERPENGYVRIHGTDGRPRAGSLATFSCEGDRVASGPTTSKCLDIGEWTFPPPKCVEPCSIQKVSNGAIGRYVRDRYSRRRYFQQIRHTERIEDNEELYLRCSKGFEVSGYGNQEEKVFCNKGIWSLDLVCEPASCRLKPPYAVNAEVMDKSIEHGGTVLYSCLSDFRKITEETVFCDHGEWKGKPPTCKSTKCSVHTLSYSGLSKGSKIYYRDGEVFRVTCDNGYRLAEGSSGEIICEGGTWNGDFPPCEPADCLDSAPPIEHGYLSNPSKTQHSSVATYVCEDLYVLVGRTLVQCTYGEWKGEPPQCKDTRCYLNELNDLRYVSTSSQSVTLTRERPNIICSEGYSVKTDLPICRNGKWDSNYKSICEESGCEIPTIEGGSLKEEKLGDWKWSFSGFKQSLTYNTVRSGSVVSSNTVLWLYCDEPYSVHGKGKPRIQIRCLTGKWSTDLYCFRDEEQYVPTPGKWSQITPTQEPFHRSSTTSTKSLPPSTTRSPGDIEPESPTNLDDGKPGSGVTPQSSVEPPTKECFCAYILDDDNIVAHADGKRLIHGDEVRNGSTVIFHCKYVGYHRFTGNREITCNNCQSWSSKDLPSCTLPRMGDAVIVFPNDVNVLEDGKIELFKGQSANFTCAAMETAMHPEWRGPKIHDLTIIRERKDRKDKGDVVFFTHLEIQNATFQNEGTYECSIEGNNKTSIQVIVTDPDLRCPEFLEDDRIIINYENELRENSKASFSCPNKGQEIIGKPLLTCLRTGNWSDPPPSCSGIRCEKINATGLLQIVYSDNREVGSYAAFHCSIPGNRTGVPFTQCLQNGTWRDPSPNCSIPSCSVDELRSSVPQKVTLIDTNDKNISLPYNSTIKLTCGDGFIVVGNPEAKCERNGKWEIDSVQCASGCQLPTPPPGSKLIMSPKKEIFKFGDPLAFSCPSGMDLNEGPQLVMCLKYGWSGDIPECKEIDNSTDSPGG